MEGVGGIGERHRAIPPGFGDVRVRVKHQLRTSTHSPPHGFWIAPAFVADHHAERQRPRAEQTTLDAEGGIGGFLGRVDLALVLPPCDGSVRIDHTRADLQAAVGHPLRAQNDGDAGKSCGICHRGPRALEKRGIGRRRLLARPSVARDEALRKADHRRASTPRVSNRGCREAHGVVRCHWHPDVREGDTNVADEGPPWRQLHPQNRSGLNSSSTLPKDFRRVEARGAVRGQPAGERADGREDGRRGNERGRIARLESVQQRRNEPGRPDARGRRRSTRRAPEGS